MVVYQHSIVFSWNLHKVTISSQETTIKSPWNSMKSQLTAVEIHKIYYIMIKSNKIIILSHKIIIQSQKITNKKGISHNIILTWHFGRFKHLPVALSVSRGAWLGLRTGPWRRTRRVSSQDPVYGSWLSMEMCHGDLPWSLPSGIS